MGVWLAGFAALGLLAAPSRQLATFLSRSVQGRLQRLTEQRADARLWAVARQDPRVMSELTITTQRDLDLSASGR